MASVCSLFQPFAEKSFSESVISIIFWGLKNEKFEVVMQELAKLRKPVDEFFDDVKVNVEDAALRKNRLLLLAQFREYLNEVANFSKIEG